MVTIMFYRLIPVLFGTFFLNASQLDISVSASSAIVINADTGAILFAKKPRQIKYPASITKIATALYVLRHAQGQLDSLLIAQQDCIGSVSEEAKMKASYSLPSHWLVTDCSHMGIKKGEALSIKDLLYGMMVASADDAANILASHFGKGDINAFMTELNHFLKDLGCQDTHFNNPHGLHHPKHVTSAYDMAIITKAALKNPHFLEMVKVTRYTRPKTNKQESTSLVQTNRLLKKGEHYYPKAIGVKTGRTLKARNTFVAAAKDGDRTLIAVLMDVKERKEMFEDAIRLFDVAFNEPVLQKTVVQKGLQKYTLELPGAKTPVQTTALEDVFLTSYPSDEIPLKAYLSWDSLTLPIKKGVLVATLHIKNEQGHSLKVVPLYAEADVDAVFWKKFSFLSPKVMGILGLSFTSILLFFIFNRGK